LKKLYHAGIFKPSLLAFINPKFGRWDMIECNYQRRLNEFSFEEVPCFLSVVLTRPD